MKINMVPSNFESVDDLIQDLITKKNVAKKYKDFAFIILENNKIPWTWLKEKLFQLLFWNMQGGVTGAGRGHAVYYAKELHEGLRAAKEKGHKYAMVCQIGMVLSGFGNQKEVKTPIQNFYEFCQSGQFMRAHILAFPNKDATIHTQHLEIDLTQWDGQNLKKLGGDYIRGYENIHDDYTPLWIEVQGLPRINNFTVAQRSQKWYTYPDRDYEKHEQILYDYIKNKKEHPPEGHHSTSSIIIREILTRKKKRFYFENNEQIPVHLKQKYDVIVCPTSGILAEYLYDAIGHKDTKVLIYDYDQVLLDTKKRIIDMGLVGKDLLMYMKSFKDLPGYEDYIFSAGRTPNQFKSIDFNESVVTNNKILKMQDKLADSNHEYVLCDLINNDFDWLIKEIKGKRVFFYASNIFQYYAVWMFHDYSTIKGQYMRLIRALKQSKSFNYTGRRPMGRKV